MGNIHLDIPMMSANMKTITGPRMAAEMRNRGALGVLHRFGSIEESVRDFEDVQADIELIDCLSSKTVERILANSTVVSIGVNGDYKERFQELYYIGARYFCIDIAHGHSIMMKETIEYIKSQKSDIYVIGGNIATAQAAADLIQWGVNAVKVGIGPGAHCQTRTNTGVGVPQLWALEEVSSITEQFSDVLLIADGGVKMIGDIAKALKFADTVMLGSFFAGCMETPGNVYKRADGTRYKVHGGSASGHNKTSGTLRPEFVEGITTEVPLGDHVKFLLREIKEGLQSACSYVGAHNLKEFQQKCVFIPISGGGKDESKF